MSGCLLMPVRNRDLLPRRVENPLDHFRIGEPFVSTHADEGLRGLGLVIVQDIMKMHSGQMEIRNADSGKGAAVSLRLPVYEQTNTDNPES